jgi:hypothetical protein
MKARLSAECGTPSDWDPLPAYMSRSLVMANVTWMFAFKTR